MDLDETNIEEQLTIHNASTYELEREVLAHPQKEAHFHRWYAQAIKEVDRLTMELEETVAIIFNELIVEEEEKVGKPLASYAMDSFRKMCEKAKIPLDKRYKVVKKKLIQAQENKNILDGLVRAWSSRGYRLGELVRLSEFTAIPEFRVYGGGGKKEKYMSAEDKLKELKEVGDMGE
jgi:hypothetical protein